MSGAQGNATKVVNAAQQTQQALSNAGKTVVSALQSSQPAKMIPLLLGLASLTALFVGFGMQYFFVF